MFKRLFIAAVLIALFLGGVAYFQMVFKPAMIADFVSKMAPPPATVTAEPAKTETWIARVHSIGTLVAIEGVEVAPQLGGTVMDYFFDSGQEVTQGEKLVQLDISVEEADLVSAKATLHEADLDRERQASLVQKGAVSQAILDTSTAKRDSAAAAMARIEAIIAQKTITAPFTGKLGLRRVEKGQYVSPGQALVWLQALDPIWVDFPVAESEVAKFKIGSKIELTVDTYPGEVFKGEVEALDARLSQDARTLMVRGTLPNPERRLLPGMFANTAVLAGEPRELVTVPRTALTYSLYGDSVWVVKEGASEEDAQPTASAEGAGAAIAADAPEAPTLTAERRFVRVGQTEEGRIAILEGIKTGEQVITSGQLKLQPGAAIKVDNADALKPPAELPKQ
ncbi:MAG: efflux RND transporter periplasmic adaptor subunit [Methyloceanibacter sp.]|jgi:membrane fusion protein (multidrug efflux system)|uniref:efflux RND transporter periplasmic adaptor subunit n=1 Tax=Methyloceanibacter sp. TaxID=1965321 RepID=UPI003D9B6870